MGEDQDDNNDEMEVVMREFEEHLEKDNAIPVAAIKILIGVISSARTMMELDKELRETAERLREGCKRKDLIVGKSFVSLNSGCELFIRYVTNCFLEFSDFDECRRQLLSRGQKFVAMSLKSRDRISQLGHNFIRDGMLVLSYGYSRVVVAVLRRAALTSNFSVIVPESQPGNLGIKTADVLREGGIQVNVISDSAVGFFMERIDLVIVGAEAVVESGGIISKLGTFQIAVMAREMSKAFYVAVESYKFARLYPLNQRDLLEIDSTDDNMHHASMIEPSCDYTPSKYVTLLFTDLGILTPAAVSDELIRLYQ